ncbi:MAG: DUF4261 domain-containing protein [Oscillospiraceae bacterium]|jgi:hypothetical protein|nr:DUF4261 domain-containing protein [Oscillospiraceae bacterium]
MAETAQEDHTGTFVSFVLLEDAAIDLDRLRQTLREDWGMDLASENSNDDSLVAETDGMMIAVSLMPAPVPNGEAVTNAKTNDRWPEAVAAAEAHRAHIMVAVLRREQPLLDGAVLYVKLCASCLKQPGVLGINTLGSVLAPDFYREAALAYLAAGQFPLLNLVFFGLYTNDGQTCCGYTYGMDVFGKQDLEILDSTHTPGEVNRLLMGVASYVIEENVTLRDGETIGFTAEQKLPITASAGAALDGLTLKIGY